LQLAHRDASGQAIDGAKTKVGSSGRLAGSYSACQDVWAGLSEVRMVQQIERFHTQLELMM
jgi:hypothetical protein